MTIHYKELIINKPGFINGDQWALKNLNDITVILGKNGSGKSILLRNIRNELKDFSHYVSPERSGDIQHNVSVMQEEFSETSRTNKRKENLSRTYREESIGRIQVLLGKIASQTGYGKSSFLDLKILEELIHTLLPDFKFSIKGGEMPPYELIRLQPKQNIPNVNLLSSGEAEIFTLALDILTICSIWKLDNKDKRLLLLDEPDTHLHPDLQQNLASFLLDISKIFETQIIIATHSTTLLSSLGYYGGKEVSVIFLNNAIINQKVQKFDDTLQELTTCLGGHALMGPLFNAPLLLVEGDDDYRIWSQVPRHPKNERLFSAIPCDGDKIRKYQKTLENIFVCLRANSGKPAGYVLLDGDKPLPEINSSCPQNHIKYLKLAAHECENLYLTDEVLGKLGLDWNNAKLKIKENAHNFGDKEKYLLGCEDWDRKTVDIKNHTTEIANILDPRGVHWTLRVGKCIGEKRPEGQLADFLGEGILNALWGVEFSTEDIGLKNAAIVSGVTS